MGQTHRNTDIATTRLNRSQGRFSENYYELPLHENFTGLKGSICCTLKINFCQQNNFYMTVGNVWIGYARLQKTKTQNCPKSSNVDVPK